MQHQKKKKKIILKSICIELKMQITKMFSKGYFTKAFSGGAASCGGGLAPCDWWRASRGSIHLNERWCRRFGRRPRFHLAVQYKKGGQKCLAILTTPLDNMG